MSDWIHSVVLAKVAVDCWLGGQPWGLTCF